MNDFKKGLLVGMLIIIGCGVFIANTSDNDINRYKFHYDSEGVILFMLDSKTGSLYVHGPDVPTAGKEWTKLKEITK